MRIFFLSVLTFCFSTIYGQNYNPTVLKKYVENFSQDVYEKNAQNWSICEDNQGVLYFGNYNCLLSYNGEKWSSIATPANSQYITALHYVNGDTIFWGGSGDFGYLTVGAKGEWIAISLKSKLPEIDRYFTQVWRILSYRNQLVFFTQEALFFYNPTTDSLTTVMPQHSFHLAFSVENQLFVRDRAFGLMRFDGLDFQEITGGEVFRNDGVFAMLQTNPDSILVVSQTLGYFYYLPNDKRVVKHEVPDNYHIVQQEVMAGFSLRNGLFGLTTASNGVIIIDGRGRAREWINLQSGISDNDVKWLHQDQFNNLWLATNNGISFVNYASDQSFFLDDEQSALPGSAKFVELHNGEIFVGTTSGLFRYNQNAFIFESVAGIKDNLTALCPTPYGLFIGTTSSLYLLNNESVEKLIQADVRSIDFSESFQRLYVTGNNGFFVLDHKSNWKPKKPFGDFSLNVLKSLLISEDFGADRLWLGTFSEGLWLLELNEELQGEPQHFSMVDGQEGHYIVPLRLHHSPAFGMPSGVWVLYSDSTMPNSKSQTDLMFVPHSNPALERSIILDAAATVSGDFLIHNGQIAQLDTNGILYSDAFKALNVGKLNDLSFDSQNRLWIASNQGITVMDLNLKQNQIPAPDIRIDNLMLLPDSLLKSRIFTDQPVLIAYSSNSFRFHFSSIFSVNGFSSDYSFMLENYDSDWSEWSDLPFAEYKQVREGVYTFKVRSKNVFGKISDIQEVRIEISSPWYRTWWAYGLYLLGFVLLVVLITRAYVFRLKQKNRQLEAIIKERTREIVAQKDEIEKQRDLITEAHDEIRASIKYAQRIQSAVLPSVEINQPRIKDYFIFFKPRDVVSGDFYWARKSADYLIVTAADCTGHGVPGAFMSMLGVSLLNDIVGKEGVVDAGEILNGLRKGVIDSLKQDKEVSLGSDSVKDGMDISLCSIHLPSGEISWAGANNPLFIISSEKPLFSSNPEMKVFDMETDNPLKLFEIKPDKMPIAISERMKPFTSQRFKLQSGDQIYLFSDGFVDQFGGPHGKKFMIKAFRNLLLNNATHSMEMQAEKIDNQFVQWRLWKDDLQEFSYPQVDDITIIGLKF